MPTLATRVRPSVAVRLGLVSRARKISNDLDRVVSRIGERLGSNSDIADTLELMRTRVEGRLIKQVQLLLYHGDIIVVSITASIDWKKSEFHIAATGATIKGDEADVTASTEQFTNHLDQFLRNMTRHTRISNVRVVFQVSDEAIAEHGLDEARRLAKLEALSATEIDHVGSFEAIGDRPSFADPALDELSFGMELGRSKPHAHFARRK